MDKYQTLKLFDYCIFTSSLDQLDCIEHKSQFVINTLNQYSYIIAGKQNRFKSALTRSDMLLPDGIGIVWAVRLLKGKKIKKIAGADLHSHLLNLINKEGGSCFYLGSSPETLQGIKKRLCTEYPNIRVGLYSPPFRSKFSEAENACMIKSINDFKPDVLFVGMTAPKQEKWVAEHKDRLNANVICSVGAVFDFYSEMVKRPGRFWINLGLEWFIRLLNEPNHLWKRYLLYGPVFVYEVFKEKFNLFFKRETHLGVLWVLCLCELLVFIHLF